MRDALTKHPVKGTTAAVSVVNESKNTLSVHKIEQFSSFHNFRYESSGLRVWKCYGIGKGKQIPYDDIYIKHQAPTMLSIPESQGFYDHPEKREIKHRPEECKKKENPAQLFECSVHGCLEAFDTFEQLELHLDVGQHNFSKLKQFDAIRRDWALKFASVDIGYSKTCSSNFTKLQTSEVNATVSSSLQQGWALSKPRSNIRFSKKVKEYLTARFTLGERTGRKADPTQVASGMRTAKNESNERLFSRNEWLTKTQVQGFFSRLAVKCRKGQGVIDLSDKQDEDVECLQEHSNRQDLVDLVNGEINVSHPICYDTYDLCERYLSNTLKEFNVSMLKTICGYFEIPVKSRDKKQVLIDKLSDMIQECECVSP
ncbi:uncharacterized protein LOC114542718 [Dendronephthya gigantea]|uniref:uncharacterized protein LOC114542718 n=1 Tax=Dendronephthya gigantea TaxID=151771 RepID=UPI00106C5BE0|nr:uncharacterized protein LOC114542718 [Dendronephthya gigantea]